MEVVRLVIVHTHDKDIDDFVVVIQAVYLFQPLVFPVFCFVAGIRRRAGEKGSVRFAFFRNIYTVQHNFRIYKNPACYQDYKR